MEVTHALEFMIILWAMYMCKECILGNAEVLVENFKGSPSGRWWE